MTTATMNTALDIQELERLANEYLGFQPGGPYRLALWPDDRPPCWEVLDSAGAQAVYIANPERIRTAMDFIFALGYGFGCGTNY